MHGFHSEQERDLFLMLLSVQAVGPKVAVAVLSSGSPRELLSAIAGADAARFQAVPGIGKRTAERIIVELREKVGVDSESESLGIVGRAYGPRALAHEGLARARLQRAWKPRSCCASIDGDSPEELIAGALGIARAA